MLLYDRNSSIQIKLLEQPPDDTDGTLFTYSMSDTLHGTP